MQELVDAVRAGQSRSLVVVGPAGIGKSWLCRRASALAVGFTVVGTRGVEPEAHLGYSGLFDVVSPLLDGRLDRLLAARGDALRGALRIAEARVVDPFAVAAASLDLLAMAAEDAPVLVVVDDAPWVDAASLGALRFAARRFDVDGVGFLFAARSESAAPLVEAGLESLTVGGLDTAEAVGLVNEFANSRVEESVARALASASGGHPLWLREAARELSVEQMAGAAPLTDRFRSPASVLEAFTRTALSLSAEARYALVVLSADEQAPAPVMERALASLAIAASAMQAGIDCGLAHVEAGGPRFSHPLAQTAVIEVAARHNAGWLMRRSRGHGARRASPSARSGILLTPARARTRMSAPRSRTSRGARRLRPPRRGGGRSRPRRTPTPRCRCGSSGHVISARPRERPRRWSNLARSSTTAATRTCGRRARSCRARC